MHAPFTFWGTAPVEAVSAACLSDGTCYVDVIPFQFEPNYRSAALGGLFCAQESAHIPSSHFEVVSFFLTC